MATRAFSAQWRIPTGIRCVQKKFLLPKFDFRYVLKPQREGGGNNVYGDDIRPFLKVHIVQIELDYQTCTKRRSSTVKKEMPTSSWTGYR